MPFSWTRPSLRSSHLDPHHSLRRSLPRMSFGWMMCVLLFLRQPERTASLTPRRLVRQGRQSMSPETHPRSITALQLFNFGWFGGTKPTPAAEGALVDADGTDAVTADLVGGSSTSLGGVADLMDSMENFQQVQRVGKLTAALVADLASTTVEGVALDGKVKVTLDGQQRPVGVYLEEAYFAEADVLDVTNALTAAWKDGYQKSLERLEEKTKSFYTELGLSP